MKVSKEFKYDVAFSFVSIDGQIAQQIADRLRDRVNVFLYTERPEVFVGTDGVDQHALIYGSEARVVVVLYREEWGHTDWTRVEETAIKNRAFSEGHDFLVFVSLDNSEKPKWLPKTRIWVGFDRYGIDGIASSVESLVQSEGGMVRSESVADYAVRLERKVSLRDRREKWRSTKEGVAAATDEVSALYDNLQRLAAEVNEKSNILQLRCSQGGQRSCAVVCHDCQIIFAWILKVRNSLHDAELQVRLIRQYLPEYSMSYQSRQIEYIRYEADIDYNDIVVWREKGGEERLLTSAQLAESWMKRLLEEAASETDDSRESLNWT